jgi:hypothetical protein
MAFDIGNVTSPQVTQALIRRGENRGAGGGITRRDPLRRTVHKDASAQDQLAFDREQRAAERQAAELDAAGRREDFNRERFEFGKEEAGKDREDRQRNSAFKREQANAPNLPKIRTEATGIIEKIGRALTASRKVNPDTGQPDPVALKQGERIVAALWQQLTQLGLPGDELSGVAKSIRMQLGSTPPQRGGGFDRGAQPQGPSGAEVRQGIDQSAPNAEPPGEELLQALASRGFLERIPQGAQIHDDGTMTLMGGQRVPITPSNLEPAGGGGKFSRADSGQSKVDSGITAFLGTPTRTP